MRLEIVEILKKLDFTEYEAKAYLALLEKSPLTGYGVALNSGVPRSKIYEVLDGMAERGEVIISHGAPSLYIALNPEELINKKRVRTESTIKKANKLLEQYKVHIENSDNIWNINGRDEIIGRICEIIKKANHSILLEFWADDLDAISSELKEASARGVDILIVSNCDLALDYARIFKSTITDEHLDYKDDERWIAISADSNEILLGVISLGNESLAAWTSHHSFVGPINELIKRDIYIMEIFKDHEELLESSYGKNLVHLKERLGFNTIESSISSIFTTN